MLLYIDRHSLKIVTCRSINESINGIQVVRNSLFELLSNDMLAVIQLKT